MSPRPNNSFLLGLSPAAFDALSSQLTPVDLKLGQVIFHTDDVVEWVHFPERTLLSLIVSDSLGQSVETTMVGSEGAAGLLEASGSGVSGVECVVQVDGAATRAPASHCAALIRSNPNFSRAAWTLMELQTAESRQSALCQALHSVEQRFSRWMLESSDRSGGRNPLPMTHEFLSAMLGVQRTTVTTFASQLQATGAIRYSRGKIDLLDRPALEHRACECRSVMQAQRQRLGLTTPPY